ncbi:MAG: S41 family peptidase [Marinilabiliaceae bacterium]
MRNIRNIFIISLMLLLSVGHSAAQSEDQALKKVELAWQLISNFYVDSVESDQVAEEAIKAMLKELDPHSSYIPAEDVEAMNEPLEGNFEGIGIEFMILDDTLTVVATIPGGPSEKVGLMAGDQIMEVDGEDVAGVGLSNNDVFDLLRGPKGTEVKLGVLRNEEKLSFNIERDEIPIHSVEASYKMTPQTGYIKISRFSETTHQEFKDALEKLKDKQINNLVLDLRGNGGGYLKASLDIADEFIGERRLLLYTDGRSIPRSDYNSSSGGMWEDGRLIVLINEGSASASEIVAGAVQDWDRGIIMGRRSFGKGLVQRPFPLPDGAEIRLTIARYYTPSGRSIQKPYENGVEEYREEIFERYEHGEFVHADSVSFPDSLVFKTKNKGRNVYGGGGIFPDVFLPLDTTHYTDYYRDLVASGTVNRFVIDKLDEHRNQWEEKYSTFSEFEKEFQIPEQFVESLIDRGEDNGIAHDEEELEKSLSWMKLQIKALIARNIWDDSEYYQILNHAMPFFERVIKVIEDPDLYSETFGDDQ